MLTKNSTIQMINGIHRPPKQHSTFDKRSSVSTSICILFLTKSQGHSCEVFNMPRLHFTCPLFHVHLNVHPSLFKKHPEDGMLHHFLLPKFNFDTKAIHESHRIINNLELRLRPMDLCKQNRPRHLHSSPPSHPARFRMKLCIM